MIEILADNIRVEKIRGKKRPIYEQIRHQIHGMIKSGEIVTGQELPSISSMSEKLNVNYRTIKSALELLEKDGLLNCLPNKRSVVRGYSNQTPKAVEALCFAFLRMTGDDFFVSTSAGIKRYADENSIDCVFIDTSNDHERFLDALAHPGQNVSGLIFAPYESPSYYKAISLALKRNTNMVFIDRVLPNVNVTSVSADHFMGAYEATKHLLENHPRAVYYIGNTLEPSSCRDRVSGWRSAMHSYGFPACSSYLIDIGYTEVELSSSPLVFMEYEVDAATKFFNSHDEQKFSILASNDYTAKAIYIAAEKKGMVIGKDVFIVGFGNLPMASRLNVPLSSVNQYSEQVGYEAARALFETITGSMPKPVQKVLPVDLVIRDSSQLK